MLIVIFIILWFFLCFFIYHKTRTKLLNLDLFQFSMYMFIFLYIIIPFLLPLSYCYDRDISIFAFVTALLGLITFMTGYALCSKTPNIKLNIPIYIDKQKELLFWYFILFISVCFLYVYASAYGGFKAALALGALARYTGADIEVNRSVAVAQYFIPMLSILVCVSQFKLYKKSRYKKEYFLLLVVSLSFALLYGLIKSSRGSIVNLMLLMLFLHINVKGFKLNLKRILILMIIFIVGFFFIVYGKLTIAAISSSFRGENLSVALSNVQAKDMEYAYGRLIAEFSHPIRSLNVVIDADVEWNYMKHFFVAPLHLIPTRLLDMFGDKPYRITEDNTYLLTGSSDGGIPPGLIASFWYGGGLFGALSGCLLYGFFIAWVQKKMYFLLKKDYSIFPIVVYIFYRFVWFPFSGDLSVFLKHQFHLFFFLFIYFVYKKFIEKKYKINYSTMYLSSNKGC